MNALEMRQLANKLSLLHRVHESAVAVVWDAFPDTLPRDELARDPRLCIEELVSHGFLVPADHASRREGALKTYTVPTPLDESSPMQCPLEARADHRALAQAFLAVDSGGPQAKDHLAEALVQCRGAQEWPELEHKVYRYFMDLLGSHESYLTRAFSGLPAAVLRGNPGLQFAAGTASMPLRKGLSHAAKATEASGRFAALITEVGQVWQQQTSADGVLFLGSLWLSWLRKRGDVEAAREVTDGILSKLRDFAARGDVPSNTNRQWFELERGTTAMFSKEWGAARAHLTGVLDMPLDFPEHDAFIPLLSSAVLELLHSLSGQPSIPTLHLRSAQTDVDGFREHSDYTEYVVQLSAARMALDRLDLEAAERHVRYLTENSLSSEFWEIAAETGQLFDLLHDRTLAAQARQTAIVGAVSEEHRSSPLARAVRLRSRVDTLLAVGQLERARELCENTPGSSTWMRVSYARLHLIGGRFTRTEVLAAALAADDRATAPERAIAHSLAAAAFDADGDRLAAVEQVARCVDWSSAAATLLPIALLPRAARGRVLTIARETGDFVRLAAAVALTPEQLEGRFAAVGQCFPDTGVLVDLTKREHLVLQLLDSGMSQTEIASQLSVSLSTLKKQTGSVYRKLGVGSRNEALRVAHVHGLIDGIGAAQAAQATQGRRVSTAY